MSNKDYKALLKVYSIDKIEKNTIEYAERINEGVKQIFIEANLSDKKKALEKTPEKDAADIMSFLFFTEENEYTEEVIFNMKLYAFNMDEILNASDELKEQIRNETNTLALIKLIENGISGSVEVN